ncbi:MAG: GDSL-type esterase/lipase family protein [Bifidobacteriaceae bacterium]|nr:GDSL-type esterase/lipase family protein [Bifidobacteriaceae bacterium]
MFDSSIANTWVFVGGANVEGGFSQTRGVRNYVSQFEEYIRWALPRHSSDSTMPSEKVVAQMQRYITNTASAGTTLHDVVADFTDVVTPLGPKYIDYMIGPEDTARGAKGIKKFSKDLRSLIKKSLALRLHHGFVVIQTAPSCAATICDHNARLYSQAASAVIASYKAKKGYKRIVFVDHYSATKSSRAFRLHDEDSTGHLNAAGHLAIARHLIASLSATAKAQDSFTTSDLDISRTEVAHPTHYRRIAPLTSVQRDSITITLPQSIAVDADSHAWSYSLDVAKSTAPVIVGSDAKYRLSGPLTSRTITLRNIPGVSSDKSTTWNLTVRSADGATQLTSVSGSIGGKSSSESPQSAAIHPVPALEKKLKSKKPLTWLFMGDSITHGEAYTKGHDSISQTVEKYLKGELGRTRDVVLNTAVAGTTTTQTLQNINQRLNAYSPDVVALMIGTNDSVYPGMTPAHFARNLRTLITDIKDVNPHALIVLRSPTPGDRSRQVKPYVAAMKKVADQDSSLIYIDQFTQWQKLSRTYPWLIARPTGYANRGVNQILMGNALHPGYNGQLVMSRQFLKALGLWTPDTAESNLTYETAIAQEHTTTSIGRAVDVCGVGVRAAGRVGTETDPGTTASLTLDVSALRDIAAQTSAGATVAEKLGGLTANVTSQTSDETRSASIGASGTTLTITGLSRNAKYRVTVDGYGTSNASHVTFPAYRIETSAAWEKAHKAELLAAENDTSQDGVAGSSGSSSGGLGGLSGLWGGGTSAADSAKAQTVGAAAAMIWLRGHMWKVLPWMIVLLCVGGVAAASMSRRRRG